MHLDLKTNFLPLTFLALAYGFGLWLIIITMVLAGLAGLAIMAKNKVLSLATLNFSHH